MTRPLSDRSFNLCTKLLTKADFACQLDTHVNYLNRAVREATGKTTSTRRAGRIAGEARRLLRYSDWPLALVANSLGFAIIAYFSFFFASMPA